MAVWHGWRDTPRSPARLAGGDTVLAAAPGCVGGPVDKRVALCEKHVSPSGAAECWVALQYPRCCIWLHTGLRTALLHG